MTVDLGPAAQPRRIPTQEERLTATDRIRLTGRCHTTDQHHQLDGDTADARSQDRALREALAERDQARQAAGIAYEVLAVVRDAMERMDRALATYDTTAGA